MPSPPEKRRRPLRLVVLLGILGVVGWQLPAILEIWPGPILVKRALEKRVDGTVEVSRLDLSWAGPQRVAAVRVSDGAGRADADLDVSVGPALLPLLLGSPSPMVVDITGALRSDLGADGTLALQRLLKPQPSPAASAAASRPAPALEVHLRDVALELRDGGSGRDLRVEGLRGSIVHDPGASTTAALQGTTRSGDLTGSIALDAQAIGLFDDAGALTPRGASGRVDVRLKDVPVLLSRTSADVLELSLSITSADLTGPVQVEVGALTRLGQAAPSRLEGRIMIDGPLDERGGLRLALDRVSGSLEGTDVPTALLQPLLARVGLPLEAERDIGPGLNLSATTMVSGTDRALAITADAARVQVRLMGELRGADRDLHLSSSRLAVQVAPQILEPLLGVTAEGPLRLALDIERGRLPLDPEAWETSELEATARIEGPAKLGPAARPELRLAVEEAAWRVHLGGAPDRIAGRARVGGAAVEAEATLPGILAAAKAGALSAVRPAAKVTVSGVTADLLARLFPLEAELIGTVVTAPLEVSLATDPLEEAGLRATVTVAGAGDAAPLLEAAAVEGPAGLRVERARVHLARPGAVVAWLQRESEAPLEAQWGAVTLDLEPVELPGSRSGGFALAAGPLRGAVTVEDFHLPAAPLRASGTLRAGWGDDSITLDAGTARLVIGKSILAPTESADAAAFSLAEDVAATLSVDRIKLPAALLRGEPCDAAAVAVQARLAAEPFTLVPRAGLGSNSRVRGVSVALECDGLDSGALVRMNLESRVQRKGQEWQASSLEARADRLRLDPAGGIDLAATRWTGLATIGGFPTMFIDGLADFSGFLVAALGESIGGSLRAQDLAAASGTLGIELRTANGALAATLQPDGSRLRSVGEEPIRAELAITPALTERLLVALNPFFTDLRSTQEPLRVTVTNLGLPLDGKPSGLDADVQLTLGPVELDSNSTFLSVLAAFERAQRPTVNGYVEPIRMRIRSGVVTYDRFEIRIEKYAMAWAGKVDLNTGTMDLRSELPLAGLAHSFKELEGYADKIVVPLVTRGPVQGAKIIIDPAFNLPAAAAQAGFAGILGEIEKKAGFPFSSVLGEFLKKVQPPPEKEKDQASASEGGGKP
jgi:hypothetical protein